MRDFVAAERLRAGLAEDERAAKAAADEKAGHVALAGQWRPEDFAIMGSLGPLAAISEHIARNDPARILADIAARRRVLVLYEAFAAKVVQERLDRGGYASNSASAAAEALGRAVTALAAVYEDAPAETAP